MFLIKKIHLDTRTMYHLFSHMQKSCLFMTRIIFQFIFELSGNVINFYVDFNVSLLML